MSIEAMKQEPMALTYKEVTDTMNALRRGTLEQQQVAAVMENKKLYTTPPIVATPLAAQEEIQRLSALVRAQQITIEKLEAQHESK